MRLSCLALKNYDVRNGKIAVPGAFFKNHASESSVYWYLGMNTDAPPEAEQSNWGPQQHCIQLLVLETNRLAPGSGVI
ncbi:hypothetical protein V1291_001648 [Nitrobacteraceae bacterium AZCC 1564]